MIGETVSHFRIEAKLGQGGMGVVYRAHDIRLDRPVALKFLSSELTRDEQARLRFLQEAKATAALNHPNIVTVYEIDEARGQTFIAMEYIAGSSLRDRMADQPVPPEVAREITAQIARGLACAHERGIIHRDIKPGNILLTTDGQVKIVDFGLAMLTRETRLTRTGATLGTPAYMSPEQARGDQVTHLTDIWALGVIHYEMLTGRLPFHGEHALAQIYSILNSQPQSISELAPSVPPVHDAIVRRALAKEPTARFQSAAEMERALRDLALAEAPSAASGATRRRLPIARPTRRQLIGGVLLLALGVAAGYFALRSPGTRDFNERDWLLVTEFKDLSATTGLQSALREALVIDLQQSRHVNVFAGQRLADALVRMGRAGDTPVTAELGLELAQREGIPAVLIGSVSALGDNMLVAAQLVRPSTGESLFAKRVPAAGEAGLLPALDGLSRAIRKRLGESLRSIRTHDEPLAAVTTPSLEALRLFSRGNLAFLASDWQEALALFGQAVAQDTAFAMAYAKLARIHYYNANTYDALVSSDRAYRWRSRLTARERAYIEGEYHRYRAQYGEAIECLKALLERYPDDLEARTNLATTYMWSLEYAEALRELEKFDAGARQTWYFYHTTGNARGGLGEYGAAAESFRQALALNPTQLRTRMCLSWCYLCMEDPVAARAQLDTLQSSAAGGAIGSDYLVAKTLPALGAFAETLEHLEAGRDEALSRDNRNQAAWTYIYAGECHRRLGDDAAAVRDFTAAVDLWPGDDPLCELGKSLAQRRDFDGAERVRLRLAELARSEPTQAHQQYLRKLEGEIAFQRGDLERAVALLEECLPSYLFNLDARYTLGLAYLARRDLAGARREFTFLVAQRYSTLLEGHASLWPLAQYHLGVVAEAAGEPAEARRQFEGFLRLWGGADARPPELPEVKDARQRLTAQHG